MTKTEARSLEEILCDLGEAYTAWKAYGADKDQHREEFFTYADEALVSQGLAMKLVTYPAADEEVARVRAALHNPGWTVEEARSHPGQEGNYEIILQEDPSLQPFSHEVDGVKYARQVSRGAVMIDENWLSEDDPELFEQVVYILPWGGYVVVPPHELSAEHLSRLAKYVYNDKPRVQLTVRPVKAE